MIYSTFLFLSDFIYDLIDVIILREKDNIQCQRSAYGEWSILLVLCLAGHYEEPSVRQSFTLYIRFLPKLSCFALMSMHTYYVYLLYKRVTPALSLRAAYRPILALRTAYRHYFGLVYCVLFNNKNNHFWRFHLHKEDWMTNLLVRLNHLLMFY